MVNVRDPCLCYRGRALLRDYPQGRQYSMLSSLGEETEHLWQNIRGEKIISTLAFIIYS